MADDPLEQLSRRIGAGNLGILREASRLTIEGRIALNADDTEKAIPLLSKKHDLILQVWGTASGAAGISLVDLAQAYHVAGRQSEARAAIDEAWSIYQLLELDHKIDRLEEVMMDICAAQGHSFNVERVAKARISRLAGAGAAREVDRAMAQDNLADLYLQQRRYDEAIALLTNSLEILERTKGPNAWDTGVCCLHLCRAYSIRQEFEHANYMERAEFYGRRALQCYRLSEGPDSNGAAVAADELAVVIAFNANQAKSADKVVEAVRLSEWALSRFRALKGEDAGETLRSQYNNHIIHSMFPELGETAWPENRAIPFPRSVFISHAYNDKDALAVLMAALPDYVRSIVFEPITVSPLEYLSEKLISGILGTDGFVFIDGAASRDSFWTAFERDLAARNQKRMFLFDPVKHRFVPHWGKSRQLLLAHLYHPADAEDVTKVMRWLIDQRSFEAYDDPARFAHVPRVSQQEAQRRTTIVLNRSLTKYDDPGRGGVQIPPFSEQEAPWRDLFLFSIRTFGAIYLLFLSYKLLEDDRLLAHVIDQITQHPRSTLICWLDRECQKLWGRDVTELLVPGDLKDSSYTFRKRPTDPDFSLHELDDLTVRLYWLLYKGRPGKWNR